jgi:poly(A) polymerase
MDREPQDYDIATDARPEQIINLFSKTVPVGASFGVMKVLVEDCAFEVATFRSDGRYLDGRHPTEVHFSSEKEDAFRRDFTINGMFFDPIEDRLIDCVQGKHMTSRLNSSVVSEIRTIVSRRISCGSFGRYGLRPDSDIG